jgi:pectate lyase
MKKQILTILASFGIVSQMIAQTNIPAFPEAEGAGTYTKGGRGGRVIEVINLNDSGVGSFRAACEASGARIVVFRVSGTIELTNRIVISDPYITIAGQTAPDGGITLSGVKSTKHLMIIWETHDVVVRYIRFRKGYNASTPSQDGTCSAIMQNSYNIVFDHCSYSWTQDENIQVWNSGNTPPPREITFSNNLVYEPLKAHAVSILTGGTNADNMINIDFHHNLVANSSHRNPLIKSKSVRWINNIVYNWGYYATQGGGGVQMDVINNIYKSGPLNNNSRHEVQIYPTASSTTSTGTPTLYIVGNKGPQNPDHSSDNWKMTWEIASENALESSGKALPNTYRRNTPMPASNTGKAIIPEPMNNLETNILKNVGASYRLDENGNWLENRDDADLRILAEYSTNKGFIPETENAVGGFPILKKGTAYTDTDKDGMPNAWETKYGFNPNNASDGNEDSDKDGYTNIEEFLNGTRPKENITDLNAENLENQIQIYPNPASGELFIDSAPVGSEINISDMSGRILINQKILSDNYKVDISALKQEIYLVKIGTFIKKISVE